MTVAITGASGHVGGTLARVLLERGHRVRAIVREDPRAIDGLDVERVRGDVREPDSLEGAFAGSEVVVHTAAHISLRWSETRLLEAVNVQGTANVIAACRSRGIRRLVHFSSIHAFEQRPLDEPVDETRPLADEHPAGRRLPPYDRSKAASERLARRAAAEGMDVVILNPTGVVGPFDFKPSLLGRVLLALAQGTLPALVDGGFDWVDVRDVAAAAARAVELPPTPPRHVKEGLAIRRYLLPGRWASLAELADQVAGVTGVAAPRWAAPLWAAEVGAPFATALALAAGRPPLFTSVSLAALRNNRRVSGARAAADLGHQPRDLRTSVEDALRWFAAHGMLPQRGRS